MIVPFCGQSSSGRSPVWDDEECINLYPEIREANSGAKSSLVLLGTPGIVAFATLKSTGGVVRGMIAANGAIYAVCDNTIYQVTSAGVVSTLGTITTSSGPVSMADNGLQLIIVDGTTSGYTYTYASSTYAAITDAVFTGTGASRVAFVDGYFVLVTPNSQQFYLSALNDGRTYDGTMFAAKSGQPDKLATVAVAHRQIWLMGKNTCEVWWDYGGDNTNPFPFQRIDGVFIEQGCQSPDSVAILDNTLFWLTDRGTIVRANGFVPQVVSTRAIEYQIAQCAVTSDARAFSYMQEGHWFYCITFPTMGKTWVYDVTTGMWHQRKSYGMSRWRPNCGATSAGVSYVGDMSSGRIYWLSMDAFTDAGQPIERIRTAPPICSEQKRIFARMLRADMEFGNTPNPLLTDPVTGLPRAPQACLQWTDDGGATWSNEHWDSMGKPGQRNIKVDWHRLGTFRTRSFRIKITDPVKVSILGAYLESQRGTD